jgi:hypothetical protein
MSFLEQIGRALMLWTEDAVALTLPFGGFREYSRLKRLPLALTSGIPPITSSISLHLRLPLRRHVIGVAPSPCRNFNARTICVKAESFIARARKKSGLMNFIVGNRITRREQP